jgi:ADP-ribose pyrophosphatase YjhB (NUDIX family)
MADGTDSRTYPTRPFLAVSAAIIRDGRVLIVRRARAPAHGVYTLPGGVVELGETLEEAIVREVMEETALEIEPVGLAGYRQAISRDAGGKIERHFVILPFAARWLKGEPVLNEELGEAHWLHPDRLAELTTTEGLAAVVASAFALIDGGR